MSAKNEAKPVPASPPWDSAPIIGFGKRGATMRPEKQDNGEKGKLEIVASGLQFTASAVTRIAYSDIHLIFDVKGTTDGFVSKLNQLVGDPSLRKTGGVPGTPLEVNKMACSSY